MKLLSRRERKHCIFCEHLPFSGYKSKLKTTYQSCRSCTRKEAAYFYRENEASILNGKLKPVKSLFLPKHTSLLVMTFFFKGLKIQGKVEFDAIKTSGDGNCLDRSASVIVVGTKISICC